MEKFKYITAEVGLMYFVGYCFNMVVVLLLTATIYNEEITFIIFGTNRIYCHNKKCPKLWLTRPGST